MIEQREFLDKLTSVTVGNFRAMVGIGDHPAEAGRRTIASAVGQVGRFNTDDFGRETAIAVLQRAIDDEIRRTPEGDGLFVEGRFGPDEIAGRFVEAYRVLRSHDVGPGKAWDILRNRLALRMRDWSDQVAARDAYNMARFAIEAEARREKRSGGPDT